MNQALRRRAKAVFHEALEKPPADRRAFVRETTGHEIELQTAVFELLDAHERAGPFLGAPTLTAKRSSTLAGEEAVGDVIGNFVLEEKLGEGGFGVVWRAEQTAPVRREVALKVIKLGMDTKAVVARFEAERQALALMDHPGIARVFDGGATASGRPYFVMELVNGAPITRYCDDHALGTKQRLAIFTDVCRAVQHAHQKGVIHRDIKPGNVLVTVQDGRPVPKVIDFGIAKATSARLSERTLITEARQFIGTPDYMAPEQTAALALDIDTRADVYSLGVLLYELLTGERPFDASQMSDASWGEVLRTIREVEPQKPSTRVAALPPDTRSRNAKCRTSTDLPRQLVGDLDSIVMKALEKDRDRRYDTALALAEDIERHLENLPVRASPPSAAYRFSRLVRRNRLAFGAAAIVFLALVAGIGAASYGLFEARDQREIARAQTVRALAGLESRKRVTLFLADMLKGAGPSVALGRDATILREILASTRQKLQTDLAGEKEVRASLLDIMGRVYVELGDADQGIRMHEESGRLWREIDELPTEDVIIAENNLAAALLARSRLDEAELHAREALRLLAVVGGDNPRLAAQVHNNLGTILLGQGRKDEAESSLEDAMRFEREAGETAAATDSNARVNFAELLRRRGRLDEAESILAQCVADSERALGPDHPHTLLVRANRAAVRLDAGHRTEAQAEFANIRESLARVHGPRSSAVGFVLLNSSNAKVELSDSAGALSDVDEALAIFRANNPGDCDATARALCRRGRILFESGRTTEAEPSIEEGLAMYERLASPKNSQWANALADRSMLREARQDFEGAERDLKRAIEIAADEDQKSRLVAVLCNQLAGLYLGAQRFQEAAVEVERAVSLSRGIPTLVDDDLATMIGNLAIARFKAGDFANAEAPAREAFEMRRRGNANPRERADTAFYLAKIAAELGHRDDARHALDDYLRAELEVDSRDVERRSALLRFVAVRSLRARIPEWGRERLREALALESDVAGRTLDRFGQVASFLAAFETELGSPEVALPLMRECVEIADRDPEKPDLSRTFRVVLGAHLVDVAGMRKDLSAAREASSLLEPLLAYREKALAPTDWRLAYTRCLFAAASAHVARLSGGLAGPELRRQLEVDLAILERELPRLCQDTVPQPTLSLRIPSISEACAQIHDALAEIDPRGAHTEAARRWRETSAELRARSQD